MRGHRFTSMVSGIGAAQVFRAELDDFGRRPFEREPLKKVGIFGQKRPAVPASMIPDQLVGGLLTQGGGVQAGTKQFGRQGRRQILIDQKANHEASATVLCTSLKRRA